MTYTGAEELQFETSLGEELGGRWPEAEVLRRILLLCGGA